MFPTIDRNFRFSPKTASEWRQIKSSTMVSLLLTEMSKKNLFRQVFCAPSGNFLMVILSSNQVVHKKNFHFWLRDSIFCVFGVFRGFTGENGYYCLDITCEPSKIIARWSLMSLHGVPGDFGGKGGILGHFGEFFGGKKVIFRKPHFKPCRPPVPLLKSMLDAPS